MRSTRDLSEETDRVEELLHEIKTIAIVGISRNRHKDSHYVGRYLKRAGYRVIPVNPSADSILGETAFPDLTSIPISVDAVDVFVPEEWVPEVVSQSIPLQPKAIWLQLGTGTHPELVELANTENITIVQNRCMKVDHQFLVRDKQKKRNRTCTSTPKTVFN